MNNILNNKHVVVTGASRGIGAAIAQRFATESMADNHVRLTLMGRDVDTLSVQCEKFSNARAVAVDVGDGEAVQAAFEQARKESGPIDILVNNAGAVHSKPFKKISDADWLETINVNLNGVFYCSRAVIDDMLSNKWGRIINIASTAALKGYQYVSAYCAAKHGVIGLTRALALEVAEKNITVNAVCPGYTDTDIVRQAVKQIADKTNRSEEQALDILIKENPQQRLIAPQEIAGMVLWLCSGESGSITGQSIAIAGGEIM